MDNYQRIRDAIKQASLDELTDGELLDLIIELLEASRS